MTAVQVETDDFRVEVGDDGVADVIFGPPGKMPTTSAQGHGALADIWPRLNADPRVRAVLVRSEGKGFCAAGTIDLVDELLHSEEARERVKREARALVHGMVDCDLPIVSAINGAAVGAGAAVALLADISIVGERAKIFDGHLNLGVAAGDHAVLVWPLLCGLAKAKYYLYSGQALSGAEAERIGLVSLCVPDEQLEFVARQTVVSMARRSRTAIAATKRSLNHWLRAGWPAFEHSLSEEMIGFAGPDAREGLLALREKREPKFF